MVSLVDSIWIYLIQLGNLQEIISFRLCQSISRCWQPWLTLLIGLRSSLIKMLHTLRLKEFLFGIMSKGKHVGNSLSVETGCYLEVSLNAWSYNLLRIDFLVCVYVGLKDIG